MAAAALRSAASCFLRFAAAFASASTTLATAADFAAFMLENSASMSSSIAVAAPALAFAALSLPAVGRALSFGGLLPLLVPALDPFALPDAEALGAACAADAADAIGLPASATAEILSLEFFLPFSLPSSDKSDLSVTRASSCLPAPAPAVGAMRPSSSCRGRLCSPLGRTESPFRFVPNIASA
jgi:hypothetical protein